MACNLINILGIGNAKMRQKKLKKVLSGVPNIAKKQVIIAGNNAKQGILRMIISTLKMNTLHLSLDVAPSNEVW